MKTFTIENETNNITAHASGKEAGAAPNSERFGNEAALAKLASNWPPARLVEIWNSLPGVTPVRKFKDRPTAVSRIWKAVQNLGDQPETVVPETPGPATTAHVAPQEADVALEPVRAKHGARRARNPPVATTKKGLREGSKTETILGLLKRPDGATLKAIMNATGWQAHSVRGFVSGALGRKMGLVVVSIKTGNGERNYSIKA